MYEHRTVRPLPFRLFLRRLVGHFLLGTAVIFGSLGIGMVGYHACEGLSWLDSFLNASMLLGGMGPVDMPRSTGGKLFAGAYALYSGLVFLVAVAILLAPVFHRILHKLHWEQQGTD